MSCFPIQLVFMHTTTFTLLSIFSLVETITLENLEKKHCPTWHAKCSLTVSFRGLDTLVVVRLTANPRDFLIRDSADFTVQRNAKKGKKSL